MIASGNVKSVSFWNIKTFTKKHTVECCDCFSLNGLIELPNLYVAVSGIDSSTIDVIINTETCQLIKQIQCKGYISGYGSAMEHSFTLIMDIVIISSSKGKYIIANIDNRGISIFKVNYI